MNHLIKHQTNLSVIVVIFFGLLAICFSIFRGNVILDDPFHHGEFFAATVGLLENDNHSFQPLTIHGALDFVPALIAQYYWGDNNYFLPTFAIYKALHFLAAFLLILIAYRLTRSKPYQELVILAVVAASPLLVGSRDLFLLFSLYLFLQFNDRDIKSSVGIFLQILFGFTVAFGLFWSYDRGIAGSLSLGIATLVLLYRNYWYVVSLISFFVTVGILSWAFEVFSIKNYLSSIFSLMELTESWSFDWNVITILITIFTSTINFCAVISLIYCDKKYKSLIRNLPLILCLSSLSIFMLKIGINRADATHIYWTLWMPMLIGLHIYGKEIFTKLVINILYISILFVAILLTILLKAYGLALVAGIIAFTNLIFKYEKIENYIILLFGSLVFVCYGVISYNGIYGIINEKYKWIGYIISPPSNRFSSTEGVVWASDQLQKHDINCVFDLSNNGVINGLTRRPSCSRFTYPIYASPKREGNLIADLRNAFPPAIVYSSTYWSYKIDGRDMKVRFPKLDQFIVENYTREICHHGYCVRYIQRQDND